MKFSELKPGDKFIWKGKSILMRIENSFIQNDAKFWPINAVCIADGILLNFFENDEVQQVKL